MYSLVFYVFVELLDLGGEAEHGVEIIGEDLRDCAGIMLERPILTCGRIAEFIIVNLAHWW